MAQLLRPQVDGAGQLKQLLARSEPVLAPGAFDAFSARLVESASFPAVYMTGFGTAAAVLGRPDVGLLTMTEMVENAKRIVAAVDVPVIADCDTGYGNPINVIRAVQDYERAGVAAIHIEDQIWPKKCGHMDRKQVIAADEMAAKIRAAKAAQGSPDFTVIARTDARAVYGVEDAFERAQRYRAAGADMLFIEALQTEDEIAAAASEFADCPLVFNWAEGGKTPPVELARLAELGFRLIIFPLSTLAASMRAMQRMLSTISRTGTPAAALAEIAQFDELLSFIGAGEIEALKQQFADEAEAEPTERR